MDWEKRIKFVGVVVDLVLKYGIPGALEILGLLSRKDEPSLEEIEALRNRVPHPDTFRK